MTSNTVYPEYEQICLFDNELIDGYYSLGFLQAIRPDCVWITPDQWQDYNNYEWLDQKIKQALEQEKTVCVVPWDENIIYPKNPSFCDILNSYASDPVWLITQLDDINQKMYTFQFGLRCKILEIPWWFLNDCLAYEKVSKRTQGSCASHQNYLCMLGCHRPHKFDLAKELHNQGLDKFGLITVMNPRDYPKEAMNFCQTNPVIPYQNLSMPQFQKMAAQHQVDDIWISSNVANFLHLETFYADIPLIIHPETTCGIFLDTEKSLWPLLLGKLMLIHGKAGVMNSMQRFYDVDFSTYADLSFDQTNNDYTEQGHRARLNLLVDLNRPLIQDCKEIYLDLQPQLELARWNLGRNIYAFIVQQLTKIL
jgi:hypothetical protein